MGNWSTRGLDNSRTSQLADWTTRGLADAAKRTKTKHAKSPVASASCPVRELSSNRNRPSEEMAVDCLAMVGTMASNVYTDKDEMCQLKDGTDLEVVVGPDVAASIFQFLIIDALDVAQRLSHLVLPELSVLIGRVAVSERRQLFQLLQTPSQQISIDQSINRKTYTRTHQQMR